MSYKKWTNTEIEDLRNLANTATIHELCARFKRSPASIRNKAHKLDISLNTRSSKPKLEWCNYCKDYRTYNEYNICPVCSYPHYADKILIQRNGYELLQSKPDNSGCHSYYVRLIGDVPTIYIGCETIRSQRKTSSEFINLFKQWVDRPEGFIGLGSPHGFNL